MPVKFKDDYKKFDRATKKTTVEKYYIKIHQSKNLLITSTVHTLNQK